MAKKERVNVRRTEDFEEVDEQLSEAMSLLDAANDRIASLLDSDLTLHEIERSGSDTPDSVVEAPVDSATDAGVPAQVRPKESPQP